MKSIICFTESLGGGGAEHQMVILAGMLADKGYNVTIVTYGSSPDHYSTPNGVKRIDIGKTKVRGKTLKAIVKVMKVFKYFIGIKTDCVISYRQCANARVLLPMLFKRKIKTICSERNITTKLNLTERILFGFLYNRADYIVPNSKTQTDFIQQFKPQLSHNLHTIHNYTDLHQFKISKIPTDISIVKMAVFSRFSPQKNPIGFAKVICELKKKTNRQFEIHWFGNQKNGDGSFDMDYLNTKQKIEELGVEEVFVLYQAVKDPSQYMDDYHAICLPSLFEGFSNSVAEGICSGKPMLVSDVSDNSIMVEDGVNGFLFNPNHADSICDAFLKFFELSYEDMCHMALCSRKIAEDLFDKEHFVQQYINLIES